MMRLLLLLLLLLPVAARAQTTPATAAAAEATALRQVRQLVLERRYESAWQLLELIDPANAVPAVVLQKADVALNYYAHTEGLRHFAFRNLKLLDLSLDSLRQLGQDSVRYAFPVRKVLERLQTRFPDNYKISRALGDYYYTVQQCDCAEQELGEDEVFRRTIAQYQQAHAHGQGDYLSYFALGYAYQRLGQFQESLAPFERALQLRPGYATAHLNLAFVLLELKQFEKARYHARSAQALFSDAHHQEDAGFLLSQIEERMK
ncbi:tetratricopeptide repeat protein [Hymenobacter metallilatus]|uniref:Tetratricopeptide repeat protein n=1 Tax=Hymenobacter metallilatus TaxID=2493666 RepID=A0A3R9PGJ4_9BACT|nr:tetratricopeptide repeat protein [Hymenobacter metallilatus]RSK37562.1 tetratricopeptide repeat protein [Hymenobacter metallilatus]